MLDALTAQHIADMLGNIDRDRADQNRLSLGMRFFDSLYHCMVFLFFRHINSVIVIDTLYRTVCRNLHNVHTVDIPELLFLGQRRTGHTGFLFVFIEEVLERDRRKRLALTFYLYMLFCLNRLMQTVRVTASRHDTSGKLIDDHNLIILYDVILITEHQIVRTQCKIHIVLDLKVLWIRKVGDVEEPLYLLDTLLSQVNDLIFFIDDKISCLRDLLAHERRHLCNFAARLAAFQLSCKDITDFIQLRRLAALTGNNQRCTRLIDQNRVDLIDNCVGKLSLYQLFLVDNHVVTQIIESQLIVRYIGDIARVLFSSFVIVHGVQYASNGKSEEFVYLSHPGCVTVCQIVVDRNDMHALSGQCI